ncbi:MAG: hypothetical protein K5925_02675 [Bacilli bacterium]|nr:hypothetical protein [Bacilli bacterium]
MNKTHVIFIVISVITSAIIFIASENIFLTAAVLVAFLLFTFVAYVPNIVKFSKVTKRFHECYHFISNFVISLSIKKVIALSLENTTLSMNSEFVDMMSSLENMNDMEKLRYLNTDYFPFHIYRLFLQVIDLYLEEGGDILESTKYLLEQCRYGEEYVTSSINLANRKYVNFGTLWAISLSILVLLRFTLTDFYSYIKNQLIFIVSLGVISLFLMVSIFLLIREATKIKIKGYDEHEKII